nr:MAG TPA: glycosylhydrolase [Caudoviricetes sp.]
MFQQITNHHFLEVMKGRIISCDPFKCFLPK